jgi:hypothetical protein
MTANVFVAVSGLDRPNAIRLATYWTDQTCRGKVMERWLENKLVFF